MHPGSGVITSSDIADSPVMEEMGDNRGLIIICNVSYKHYLTITSAYFLRHLIKCEEYSYNFYFHVVLFSFVK